MFDKNVNDGLMSKVDINWKFIPYYLLDTIVTSGDFQSEQEVMPSTCLFGAKSSRRLFLSIAEKILAV